MNKFFDEQGSFDILNLDVTKILDNLHSSKNNFIILLMIVGTCMAIKTIYTDQATKTRSLQKSTQELNVKISTINELQNATGEVERFVDTLPQGSSDINQVINALNDIAIKNNIQILSFLPLPANSTELYTQANLRIRIAAAPYQNIGLFIKNIEESGKNLRVESWSTVELTISSIGLKK